MLNFLIILNRFFLIKNKKSPGLFASDYLTGAGKIITKDLELSTLDADKSIGISLKQEEKYLWIIYFFKN